MFEPILSIPSDTREEKESEEIIEVPETEETKGPLPEVETSFPEEAIQMRGSYDSVSELSRCESEFSDLFDKAKTDDLSLRKRTSRITTFGGQVFLTTKASGEGHGKQNIVVEEELASRIYQLFGFHTPPSKVYGKADSRASKFIFGSDLKSLGTGSEDFEKLRAELKRAYVLDKFLAVQGGSRASGVEIRMSSDGTPYRMLLDGFMSFDRDGDLGYTDFGEQVSDLDSSDNSYTEDISLKEICEQIDLILSNKEKILSIVDSVAKDYKAPDFDKPLLKKKLEKRIESLKTWGESKKEELKLEEIYETWGGARSYVSYEYMQELKNCRIEGLVDVAQIEKRINYVEKVNTNYYRNCAQEESCAVEELKSELQKRVEEMVAESDFYRATYPDVLKDVLTGGGRFKSQFETGTSNGWNNPTGRSKVEFKMFGFPDNPSENCLERPIYGYFSARKYGVINGEDEWPPRRRNVVTQYGDVTVKIKRDVAMRKATITFRDSLNDEDELTPTPASHPHFTSVNIVKLDRSIPIKKTGPAGNTYWTGGGYTEVQFHGGLSASDIEAIYVSKSNGLYEDEIKEVKEMVEEYNVGHPENPILFEEY